MKYLNKAVFLDRDGVIIKDVHLLTRQSEIIILEGVTEALISLKASGYLLIVVTNQPVVARGLINEEQVVIINVALADLIEQQGGPALDGFYFCPHHPNATLPAYRRQCNCRKPGTGMLMQAAEEWNIELTKSYLVGDRITDIIAGSKTGCRTILVETGSHNEPLIESAIPIDLSIRPNFICANLLEAAQWILENQNR